MHPAHAHWTRGRLTALRMVLACAVAMCTAAGLAQAQANATARTTRSNFMWGLRCKA